MYDIRAYVYARTWITFSGTVEYIAKEGRFLLPNTEVLVYRKWDLHWIVAKQLGDGMKLLLQYPSESYRFSNDAFMKGMSLYQEYDEDSDQWKTYLYKYGWGDVWKQHIQQILKEKILPVTLLSEKWFLRLQIDAVLSWEVLLTYEDAFSYLLGVCIAYGKPKVHSDGEMVARHVWLPLVGSITTKRDHIQKVFETLGWYGIFISYTQQSQKFGSLIQMHIQDQEVLTALHQLWWWKDRQLPVWYASLEHMIDQIYDASPKKMNSVLKFIWK